MGRSNKIHIRTLGAFRAIGPDGEDLTPRSLKACGLLALLVDAPEFTRARAALQDKLWSDRGQAQGAASLRQALSEIRQCLGGFRDALVSDRRTVSLEPGLVESDWTNPDERGAARSEGREFLEDLDVRDPEFESWVRDRRQAIDSAPSDPRNATGSSLRPVERPNTGSKEVPQIILAASAEGVETRLGKHVLQSVAQGVVDQGTAAIHWKDAAPEGVSNGPRFELDLNEISLGDQRVIEIQLVDPSSGQVGWHVVQTFDPFDAPKKSRLITEAVDRTVDSLSAVANFGANWARGNPPFHTIQQMLRTRGLDYEKLKAEFRECYEREPRGIYLAWEAFLACYMIGERRVVNLADLKDEARELIRHAVEVEPHNAVVLALASHVYSFVLGEFAVAHELAERSVKLDPNNVLGWTFLGSAKIFCDQVVDGYKCILHARQICGEGPYRHMVDFFASVAAMLNGDLDRGIAIGETVNALAPDFAPALRYLLAGYLRRKDYTRAEDTLGRLHRLEPDFEIRYFAEVDYPVPAMRKAGLLDLKRLPTQLLPMDHRLRRA